ncbi:MAG: MFS transporter, partial [Trichlorobacter sp.]|nr:MFS transporter [Trichlorobacter sp.]
MNEYPGHIRQGSLLFYRVNLALFTAGFITFSSLYDFQPLLPMLTADFKISPAFGSLALSVATFALAITLPVSGSLSDTFGRRSLMIISVISAAV